MYPERHWQLLECVHFVDLVTDDVCSDCSDRIGAQIYAAVPFTRD
jgi:hypothetical protein